MVTTLYRLIRELWPWRRQRQGKHHFKTSICRAVTILRLSHFVCILNCWWNALKLDRYTCHGIKDLQVYVQVVIKTCRCGNFKMLFCMWRHDIVLKCEAHVQQAYLSSLDQSNRFLNLWRSRCRLFLLLSFPLSLALSILVLALVVVDVKAPYCLWNTVVLLFFYKVAFHWKSLVKLAVRERCP